MADDLGRMMFFMVWVPNYFFLTCIHTARLPAKGQKMAKADWKKRTTVAERRNPKAS